jgi:succinyl-diaminopimelate desuccinylase
MDISADPIQLTAQLVNIASVSGKEGEIADAVEKALRRGSAFDILRDEDAVVARTNLGRQTRVVLVGHLDTVPLAGNLPARREGTLLYGCGSSDMKSGDAIMLQLAHQIAVALRADSADYPLPWCDVTFVFYDHEEVENAKNGLGRLAANHLKWIEGDFAIVLEPTNGMIEAGCQGTMRAVVRVTGTRSHAARSWLGSNAIHATGKVLERLVNYQPRTVTIDGYQYREGMNAVGITGGVASNTVPDECTVTVSFRFAPDRTEAEARAHLRQLFEGFDMDIVDSAPGAMPGLTAPATKRFLANVGKPINPKYGWTDVARFAALGIPAINFGPGNPALAHVKEEYVDTSLITQVAQSLSQYLFSSEELIT